MLNITNVFHNLILDYKENIPIFKPENDFGYIEYKLRLDKFDDKKIKKMMSQLKFRLNEGYDILGKHVAYYLIGVEDKGLVGYIDEEILNISINILKEVVKNSHAEISNIKKIKYNNSHIALLQIRKYSENIYIKEFRTVFLGASNHGKTTCISQLTYNMKDNGNGSSRLCIFKHTHEQLSGLTSSIKHDIIGIKMNENIIINYKSQFYSTWNKIVQNSDYVISLFDLPGSSKYNKTTIFGLLALKPHLNIIVIGIPECLTLDTIPEETIKAFEYSINSKTNFFVIFTKKDNNLFNQDKIINAISKVNNYLKNHNIQLIEYNIYNEFKKDKKYYIIVSNISGENYDKITNLLTDISSLELNHFKNYTEENTDNEDLDIDFLINDFFYIRETGYIVSGIQLLNKIRLGDKLYLGPYNGTFYPITINSIRKKQIEVKTLYEAESGSLEIKLDHDINIDKHMNILSQSIIKKIDLVSTINIEILNDKNINLIKNHNYILFTDNLIEPIILRDYEYNDKNKIIAKFDFIKKSGLYIRDSCFCIIKGENYNDVFIYGLRKLII